MTTECLVANCIDFYGDEDMCLVSYGLKEPEERHLHTLYGLEAPSETESCDEGDDFCNCVETMGEEFCLEYYGSELDQSSEEDSCDDGDDHCLCIEAKGEDFCAQFYGEEEDEMCDDGDVSCYEAMCIEENGEDYCAQIYG